MQNVLQSSKAYIAGQKQTKIDQQHQFKMM